MVRTLSTCSGIDRLGDTVFYSVMRCCLQILVFAKRRRLIAHGLYFLICRYICTKVLNQIRVYVVYIPSAYFIIAYYYMYIQKNKLLHFLIFYAPNFGEVEGAYWFGLVCPSVCPQHFLVAEKLKNRLC